MLDLYDRRARLAPGVLALAPIALLLVPFGWFESVIAIGLEGVGAVALAGIARAKGKTREPALWDRWGGPPTASLLRHRSETNPELLARAHAGVEAISGVRMPTEGEEEADPEEADQRYDAAAQIVIAHFRGDEGSRVIQVENASYGYFRNLLGLRVVGIGSSIVGLVGASGLLLARLRWGLMVQAPVTFIVCAVELFCLWFWIFHVRDAEARRAAQQLGISVVRGAAAWSS